MKKEAAKQVAPTTEQRRTTRSGKPLESIDPPILPRKRVSREEEVSPISEKPIDEEFKSNPIPPPQLPAEEAPVQLEPSISFGELKHVESKQEESFSEGEEDDPDRKK